MLWQVYVPPEDPHIVQGDVMEVTEDMDTTLVCVSPGGKPAADVSGAFAFLVRLSISCIGHCFRFTGTMATATSWSRMSAPPPRCWRTASGTLHRYL